MSETAKITPERNRALKLLEPVISDMIEWVEHKKTGSIQVNLYQGGVSNWNLVTSKKPEPK